MNKDLYDLRLIDRSGEELIKIPLGEPDARGWINDQKDKLRIALIASFVPKDGLEGSIPPVNVWLFGSRELVYYRKTRGFITAGGSGEEDHNISFYVIGYEENGIEHTVRILADVPTGIELGGV